MWTLPLSWLVRSDILLNLVFELSSLCGVDRYLNTVMRTSSPLLLLALGLETSLSTTGQGDLSMTCSVAMCLLFLCKAVVVRFSVAVAESCNKIWLSLQN